MHFEVPNILDFIFKGMLIGVIASAPMGPVGVLCVQRTVQDRRGQFIEAQELPLPEDWRDQPPLEKLMLAGVWLLWRGLPFSN